MKLEQLLEGVGVPLVQGDPFRAEVRDCVRFPQGTDRGGFSGVAWWGTTRDSHDYAADVKTFREFLDAGCDTALMEVSARA